MSKSLLEKLRVPHISGAVIFAISAGLVIINLVVLVAFTNFFKKEERLASSDEVTAHIASTLYLMRISPESEWERISKVAQTPEVTISLDSEPASSLKIQELSFSKLDHLFKNIPDDLDVSIKLDYGAWLNVKYTHHSNAEMLQIFIVSLGTVVAIALLFSMWSMLRFTGPLKQFKKAAEQLGVELRSDPVIEYGPAIVRETADAMNQMQSRIRNLLKDRNRMLAAISHDLRTPITRLKLRAQFIEDRQSYKEVINDLDDMEEMIDQILTYTKEGYSQEKNIDLDLIALIFAICDCKSEQGYEVECESEISRLAFKGRSLALKRAFTNLVGNAVKYAKQTTVKISQEGEQLIVLIEDDGPGIPEHQLDKVFTAFYRVDTARQSKTGGTGLGLAIAHDVIHDHNGHINLKNRDEGGLQVKVVLCLASEKVINS